MRDFLVYETAATNKTIPTLAAINAEHTAFEGIGVDGMSVGGTATAAGLFPTSMTQLILRKTGKIIFGSAYDDTGVSLS